MSAPIRRCVVCRETGQRNEMIRVVRRPDGGACVSPSCEGRGAYVHRIERCLAAAASQPRHLKRALRCEVSSDLLERLKPSAVGVR